MDGQGRKIKIAKCVPVNPYLEATLVEFGVDGQDRKDCEIICPKDGITEK